MLFRHAQNEGLLPGRSIESMAAASVYATCRCNGLPRLFEDIEAVTQCSRSKLKTAYGVLNVELELPTKPVAPREFLPRLSSDLEVDLPMRIERRAAYLVERVEDAEFTVGKHPAGVAAACLYTAAHESDWLVTQVAVADVAGVSTVTLRTRCNELASVLNEAEDMEEAV
jgi:transcription initiation factor TFIIB